MKRLLIIVVAVVSLGACAYKAQPIYNVDKPFPPSAQNLSMDRIERLIIAGGTQYDWRFQKAGPGHLVATETAPKFSATVDVFFDQRGYKIVHQSSVGLRDTGTTIHSHYNVWVRNLEKGIDSQLALGAAGAS